MEKRDRNNLILLGIAAAMAVALVYITWPFVGVILLALVLSFILQYPTAWIERRGHRRQTSILIVLALVFGALLFVLLDVVYVFYSEVARLSSSSVNVNQLLNQGVGGLVTTISTRIGQSFPATGLQGQVAGSTATILSGLLTSISRTIGQITSNAGLYVVELIIMTLLVFLALLHGGETVREIRALVPRDYQGYASTFLKNLQTIYHSLYVVNIASSLVSGILAAVGYAILGVPYFLTFAILVAIFGLIPVIGRAIVYVPLTIYFLFIGDPLRAIILLAFSWAVLDQVTGLYILPRMAQRTGNVPQAITILAFTAPVLAIGPLGFVVGPAIYGLALALFRTYRDVCPSEGTCEGAARGGADG